MLRFCKSYLYKSFYKNGACLITPKNENQRNIYNIYIKNNNILKIKINSILYIKCYIINFIN